jgi:hypothetical protein
MLIRITAPHFVAGIIRGDAAPILHYMRGWSVARIRAYCAWKGWDCEVSR